MCITPEPSTIAHLGVVGAALRLILSVATVQFVWVYSRSPPPSFNGRFKIPGCCISLYLPHRTLSKLTPKIYKNIKLTPLYHVLLQSTTMFIPPFLCIFFYFSLWVFMSRHQDSSWFHLRAEMACRCCSVLHGVAHASTKLPAGFAVVLRWQLCSGQDSRCANTSLCIHAMMATTLTLVPRWWLKEMQNSRIFGSEMMAHIGTMPRWQLWLLQWVHLGPEMVAILLSSPLLFQTPWINSWGEWDAQGGG